MSLEYLPIISEETLDSTHPHFRNEAVWAELNKNIIHYLNTKNPILHLAIETYAALSPNPQLFRTACYRILTYVNAQLAADQLRRDTQS